jgi:DNA-binding IclR family transcriptional regulator
LNAPKSNVRRALADLAERHMVRRVGNIYAASPENYGVRIDPARHRELVKMVIDAGRELERLR